MLLLIGVGLLLIVAVLVVQERLTALLRRSHEPLHSTARLPSATPTPATPRSVMMPVLAWAIVAQSGLWGLIMATCLWGGLGGVASSSPSSQAIWLGLCGLWPVAALIGGCRAMRDLLALGRWGLDRARRAVVPPVLAAVVAFVFITSHLVAASPRYMASPGGWTSREALQSYGWIGLLMALLFLFTVLSTVISHGLRSDEVRRLFPEGQPAAEVTPSL